MPYKKREPLWIDLEKAPFDPDVLFAWADARNIELIPLDPKRQMMVIVCEKGLHGWKWVRLRSGPRYCEECLAETRKLRREEEQDRRTVLMSISNGTYTQGGINGAESLEVPNTSERSSDGDGEGEEDHVLWSRSGRLDGSDAREAS